MFLIACWYLKFNSSFTLRRYKADVRYDGEAKPDTNVYYTPPAQGYNTLSNSILQEEPEDYQEEPEVTYHRQQLIYCNKLFSSHSICRWSSIK